MTKGRNAVLDTPNGTQTVEVISSVVKQNLCTGCGICAASCPIRSLITGLNRHREFDLALGECLAIAVPD
ncbi:4Fe-4S binding protein [Planctomycetota bacterium]